MDGQIAIIRRNAIRFRDHQVEQALALSKVSRLVGMVEESRDVGTVSLTIRITPEKAVCYLRRETTIRSCDVQHIPSVRQICRQTGPSCKSARYDCIMGVHALAFRRKCFRTGSYANCKMPKDIETNDIADLEKSLNDSATRVSAVWISFLIFSLYLLISAVTITHRQLLLAEPVKLPVLNIDLPVYGFFITAPTLFLIFHSYVVLQVILLSRTAAAYNEALDAAFKSPRKNASARQRLANTLFAQIFAGSPREREGAIGAALKAISWITLAFAPIVVLLAFQIGFLPYHSLLVTWLHRALIAADIVMLLLFWPLTIDASKDVHFEGFLRRRLALGSIGAFILVSLLLVAGPQEPQAFSFNMLFGVDTCHRGFLQSIDRIRLSRVQFVDDERLKKIDKARKEKGLEYYEGERTVDLRGRHLECAEFDGTDLRDADFRTADLNGANFDGAYLTGVDLSDAKLWEAVLTRVKMDDAYLSNADLRRARLTGSSLRGARLFGAQMAGAYLDEANLQGADLGGADLTWASLESTDLQAANLITANLFRAILDEANLDGAALGRLTGASLAGAHLRGSWLPKVQLQGATFTGKRFGVGETLEQADFTNAWMDQPLLYHAGQAKCEQAFVNAPSFEADLELDEKMTWFGQAVIFVLRRVAGESKEVASERKEREQELTASRDRWLACAKGNNAEDYSKRLLPFLIGMACGKDTGSRYRLRGLSKVWLEFAGYRDSPETREVWLGLAKAFSDESKCPSSDVLSDEVRANLREAKPDN